MSIHRDAKLCKDDRMSPKLNTEQHRAKRLADWIKQRGENQSDLSRRLGVGRAYVSKLLKADGTTGHRFMEDVARRLEKSLLMPENYLDKREEDGLAPIITWSSVDDLPKGMYAMVPRISISLAAGNGIVATEEKDVPPLAFTEEWIRSRNVSSRDNLRICKVAGDSMSPFLEDGDSVMIDLGQKDVVEGRVYCLRYGDELRIKRLYRRFDGGLRIVSDNKDFPEESLSPADLQHVSVIGRQIWRAG